MVELKFCGLTRASDAALAVELGAAWCGVIFAGGPRLLTPSRAREVLEPLRGATTRRVGVFGAQESDEILRIAEDAGLDVIQLHAANGADSARCVALRERFAGELWGVAHTRPDAARSDADAAAWFGLGASAVVLDAAVPGRLGGTGVALDWAAIAPEVARLRTLGRVLLAGGLRPENVAQAVTLAHPDAVDVSSGVESAPGIKDPERMRAFAREARRNEVR